MSNEKKNATLGMSHGTACGRLRKNILFSLLGRLGESVCFKCEKIIETVDELSIEHIKPWEGRSAELFWDIGNIAFSHLGCNVPHIRKGTPRKEAPEGTSWCFTCKKFLSVNEFWKDERRWNGWRKVCKTCDYQRRFD